MSNYSIKRTDARSRMWAYLEEATDEGNTSAALDTAARYYLRMHGQTGAYPTGQLEELLTAAEERGSLTPLEIVAILDTAELPLAYDSWHSVGSTE